jgi:hypothetical protein
MLPVFARDTKNIYLREGLKYVKGRILTVAQNQSPIVTPAAVGVNAPSYSPPFILEGQEDAYTQIFSIAGLTEPTDLFAVTSQLCTKITDVARSRILMNNFVLSAHVGGTNLHPFKLCESLMLEPQQTLTGINQNNSVAGASHVHPALESRIFQRPSWVMKDVKERLQELRERANIFYPYWLTQDDLGGSQSLITIPTGASIDIFFTVNKNIRYVIFAILANASTTGLAGDTIEMFTVDIYDPVTNRKLNNQPIARSCCSGISIYPHWLPTGWMIEPNSKIRITFNNLVTDAPTNVYWTFFGTACQSDAWRG